MASVSEVERYLTVGRAVVLLPDPPREDDYRERLYIRGWQRGTYVLLDTELNKTSRSIFRPDKRCSMRFVSEGHACTCSTVVMDLGSGSHFNFVRVQWPTNFTSVPVRRYERVNLNISCVIEHESKTIHGELADLSVGGCRVDAEKALPADSECRLSFTLPDGTPVDRVSVAICNAVSIQGGASLGCTFIDRDELAWHDIEFYVATTLTRLRGEASSRPRVVILDPDPKALAGVGHVLTRDGFDVSYASSVVDGVFMLRMLMPAILCVNQNLRELDAATFCRTIRSSVHFERLPIVLFGGDAASARPALQAGANEYIPALTAKRETADLVRRLTGVSHERAEAS